MNTTVVASELGVSTKTVQRWVKQLDFPASRNEYGHYEFTNEDVEALKKIKDQLKNGASMHEVASKSENHKKAFVWTERTGFDHGQKEYIIALEQKLENLSQKAHAEMEHMGKIISKLEKKLTQKADDVVSYQLLQHRRELEDLQSKLVHMEEQLQKSNEKLAATEMAASIENQKPKKRLKSLFSFS
ncbi:chromosome-anchoring protein RacA [Bacillus gobiensis]|uniref:chromosome-anchoring protein RacA n=1 Tax=Bacillus gobiensis TaxID=1441095 RepID=UPI003D196EF3